MSGIAFTKKQLAELFHQYSDNDIVEIARNTEAFANEVYELTDTEGQRYFLKLLKTQLPEVIGTEVQMQQHLLSAGLQTPQYLEIKPGSFVGDHNGCKFILSEYIPGRSPKEVTPALIVSFGETLAKLHHALRSINIRPSIMQWLNPNRVDDDLAAYEGPLKLEITRLIQAGKVIFEVDLPIAVIHGDLWMSNVFAENDIITTVFDLETAERTIRLIDLARTFTSMKFNSVYDTDKIIELLTKGYNSMADMPLTTTERDNFKRAVIFVTGACATWHAVHRTRYRDPYIELGSEMLERIK